MLAYKRPENIADMIVRSKLPKVEMDKNVNHNQISIRGENLRSAPDPSVLNEQNFESNDECKLDQRDIELIMLNELQNE